MTIPETLRAEAELSARTSLADAYYHGSMGPDEMASAVLSAVLPILEVHYEAEMEVLRVRADALEARNKRLRQWVRLVAETTRDALEGMEAEATT